MVCRPESLLVAQDRERDRLLEELNDRPDLPQTTEGLDRWTGLEATQVKSRRSLPTVLGNHKVRNRALSPVYQNQAEYTKGYCPSIVGFLAPSIISLSIHWMRASQLSGILSRIFTGWYNPMISGKKIGKVGMSIRRNAGHQTEKRNLIEEDVQWSFYYNEWSLLRHLPICWWQRGTEGRNETFQTYRKRKRVKSKSIEYSQQLGTFTIRTCDCIGTSLWICLCMEKPSGLYLHTPRTRRLFRFFILSLSQNMKIRDHSTVTWKVLPKRSSKRRLYIKWRIGRAKGQYNEE